MFVARRTNGCVRSSVSASGRCDGSFWRHMRTKSLKSSDQSDGSGSVGGGELGIMKIARIGWTAECGGSPHAISIAVMARDQMSAFPSYSCDCSTSGAIQ